MPWALVTGAAKRLGREFALHLASRGWDIHFHYHSARTEALSLLAEIRALGRKAEGYEADLSVPGGLEALTKPLFNTNEYPTLVVNSASGWGTSDWETLTLESALGEMRLTGLAPFFLARECVRRSPRGLVVNLLDARMEDLDKNHLAYHLAKRNLAALTRVLALEAAPGWRVNALAPGLILRPEGMEPGSWEGLKSSNPLGMLGGPEDLIRTLDYYIDSPFVTGQVIFVDGGRFLKGGFYGF